MTLEEFQGRYKAVYDTYLEVGDKGLAHRDEDLLVWDVLRACSDRAPDCEAMAELMVELAEDQRIERWYE